MVEVLVVAGRLIVCQKVDDIIDKRRYVVSVGGTFVLVRLHKRKTGVVNDANEIVTGPFWWPIY